MLDSKGMRPPSVVVVSSYMDKRGTMADISRSAKSGSANWTTNELLAFNIEVHTVDIASFFNSPELPAALAVSETILNNQKRPDGPRTKTERQFFQYLKVTEQATSAKSAVGDFAAFVLRMLDYDDGDRFICRRKKLLLGGGRDLMLKPAWP